MPIRFRCAYCNQLMAIARRKAGTVVRCPTCAGQVVVPDPGKAAPAEQPGGADLFERPDFDAPFQQPAKAGGRGAARPAPRGGFAGRVELEPIILDERRGIFLSLGKIVLLIVLLFVLMGAIFFAGMVVGRWLWPAPSGPALILTAANLVFGGFALSRGPPGARMHLGRPQ
jgi:hypothetical protein